MSALGYNTIGGTSDAGLAVGFPTFHQFVATGSVTLTRILMYASVGSGTSGVTYGIYADATGTVGAKLGDTAEATISTTPGWVEGTLHTPVAITSGSGYWLEQSHATGTMTVKYDTASSTNSIFGNNAYSAGSAPTAPSSPTTLYNNRKYSIYADVAAGADTTPPVVSSASVNAAGNTLTIAFTEAGSPPVLPASGVVGFTLTASGGAVTLSSTAISSTTFTATTSRVILASETLTLAYAPGNVTDSAGTPNALASFSGTSVTNNSTQTVATAYTLTIPSPNRGKLGVASGNFTVTPNASYTGSVTITPSGGGLSTPIVLTFSSSASQTFTITPTARGTVTLTPTNSGSLTDPPIVAYESLPVVNIVFKGDSLTYGLNASTGQGTTTGATYPAIVSTILRGSSTFYSLTNLGVSGQRIDTMTTNGASEVDSTLVGGGAMNILCFLGGTNDLNGTGSTPASAATTYSRYAAYCTARRSAGWKVVALTIPPAGGTGITGIASALFNPYRDQVNDSIRTNWQAFADGLVDLAADSRIGWDGVQTNTTYFGSDQVHFTDAGYAIVGALVAPEILRLIDGGTSSRPPSAPIRSNSYSFLG